MRQLNPTIADLIKESPLKSVPFLRLTLRDGSTRTYSDTEFSYLDANYGPYLIRPEPRTESMNHLPVNSFGQLYRSMTISLRNAEVDPFAGTKLWADIRPEIQFAAVEIGEIFLDAFVSVDQVDYKESDLIQALANTDNEEIRFRGFVDSYVVTSEQVQLNCSSDVPNGGVNAVTISDSSDPDQERRPAVPYGVVDRVPMISLTGGVVTTLAAPLNPEGTQVTVSDAAGFDASGTVYVSGERLEYTGLSSSTLSGTTRLVSDVSTYPIGTLVVFIPQVVRYAVSVEDGISNVRDVWMRSPSSGELFKLGSLGQLNLSDSSNGVPLSTLTWNKSTWLNIVDATVIAPGVSGQPAFSDGTLVTDTDDWTFLGASRVVSGGQEGWTSPGKADGDWNLGSRLFSFLESKSDKKLVTQSTVPAEPTPGAREVVRARYAIVVDVSVYDVANQVEIRAEVDAIAGQETPAFDEGRAFWYMRSLSEVVPGLGQWTFYSDWSQEPYLATQLRAIENFEAEVLFRVSPDNEDSLFEAQVLTIRVEYEYVSSGGPLDQTAPAVVQALGSGAGAELFADVDGPLIPPTEFLDGYTFPDGETWGATGVAVSAGGTYQRFTSLADWTSRVDMDGDAASFSLSGQVDSSLSDEDSPSGTASLRQDLQPQVKLVDLVNDAANWTGDTAVTNKTTGILGVQMTPNNGGTSWYQRPIAPAEDWSAYSFDVSAGLTGPETSAVFIRFKSSAVDYYQFRWDFTQGFDFSTSLVVDLTDPTNDPNYDSTTGTPDLTAVTEVEVGFTSSGSNRQVNLRERFQGQNIIGQFAGAIWSFVSEDWTGRDAGRVTFYVATDSTSSSLRHVQVRVGNAAGDAVLFRWLVASLLKGADNTIEFSLSDPENDPAWFASFGAGLDLSDIDYTVFETSVNGAAWGEQTVWWRSFDTRPAVSLLNDAQVLPAAVTDLSSPAERYELTFALSGMEGISEIEIHFSNEAPVYPAAPVSYRLVRIVPSNYGLGVMTVVLNSEDIGSPVSLDDANVVRVQFEGELGASAVLDLYDLRRDPASINLYWGVDGAIIENPADVVRHFLENRSSLPAGSVLGDPSIQGVAIALAVQKTATDLAALGNDDPSVLQQLGFQHRFQLIQVDRNDATEYRMLAARSDLTWGDPQLTLTAGNWGATVETSQLGGAIINRRRFFYAFDRADRNFLKTLRVDSGQSDLDPIITAAQLAASEADIGEKLGRDVQLLIADEAAAKDTASFYTGEELRLPRIFSLSGVPFIEGYALERGDFIAWEDENEPGLQIKARVITTTHDTIACQSEISAVEVV